MGPIGCPETSVRNYRYALRNNLEERRTHWSLGYRGSPERKYVHFFPVTCSILAVTLSTTRPNTQNFYVVLTLRLCVCMAFRRNSDFYRITELTDWFYITGVGSVHCAVRTESLYKTTVFAF